MADVRSSCMLTLENMLLCAEISLSVGHFVGLMCITGEAGINHISRVTFIGIRHVCLTVFTNISRIAQPRQKQYCT